MSDPIDREAVLDIVCSNCDYYDENESQYDRIEKLPSLYHLCDGCKHKDDKNKIWKNFTMLILCKTRE